MPATACRESYARSFSLQYRLRPRALIASSLLAAKSSTDRISTDNNRKQLKPEFEHE
jgi:hypothetical protein